MESSTALTQSILALLLAWQKDEEAQNQAQRLWCQNEPVAILLQDRDHRPYDMRLWGTTITRSRGETQVYINATAHQIASLHSLVRFKTLDRGETLQCALYIYPDLRGQLGRFSTGSLAGKAFQVKGVMPIDHALDAADMFWLIETTDGRVQEGHFLSHSQVRQSLDLAPGVLTQEADTWRRF